MYDHKGREIRFCCGGCVDSFSKDSAGYLKRIDEQIIEQQLAVYPLETCVVSGEEIGSEKEGAVNHVYKNRLARFCCSGCIREFGKDPGKYLEKLDQAVIEKQKADYPLASCVVSGEDLGSMGESVDYVHGNRLVRFCCAGCVDRFRKSPNEYLGAIDAKFKETAAGKGASEAEGATGAHGHPAEKPAPGGDHEAEPGGAGSGHKH